MPDVYYGAMAVRSFRVSDQDWAKIKQMAESAGESATDYLIRRALAPDNEAVLREAVFRLGSAGFKIMVEAGKAIEKNEKAFKRRIREKPPE